MSELVVDYYTVSATSTREMDMLVCDALQRGWQPYGNPYSAPAGDDSFRTLQAMVKYERPQDFRIMPESVFPQVIQVDFPPAQLQSIQWGSMPISESTQQEDPYVVPESDRRR